MFPLPLSSQSSVSHLQNHLRREDRKPTCREDGVPRHPPLSARPPRLQNHTHHLQHPTRHSGTCSTCSHVLPSWVVFGALTSLLSFQGPEHPNPGKPFTARGFPRHCYLPDSEKGRKVSAQSSSVVLEGVGDGDICLAFSVN